MMFSNRLYCSSYYFKRSVNIRYLHETHYEILNLKRDCSHSDIKRSFIELSKKFHPDKAKTDNTHASFVRIVEAYSILGKPKSRANYDLGLYHTANDRKYTHVYHDPVNQSPWSDPSFYKNRDKSKDGFNEEKPFYGINGMKKKPNSSVVFFCIGFIAFGVVLQTMAILGSYNYGNAQIQNKSKAIGQALGEVRARASENGNDLQLQLLVEKMNRDNNITRHTSFVDVNQPK